MEKVKTFEELLKARVNETITEDELNLLNETYCENLTDEDNIIIEKVINRFIVEYLEQGKSIDDLQNEILNEGILGSIFGGLAGFALGKAVGKALANALGIQKGVFYDLLTSRLVGAALGSSLGGRLGRR